MFIFKKHLVLCVERLVYEFAAMPVTFICISFLASQICINLIRDTFQEEQADKVCIFS